MSMNNEHYLEKIRSLEEQLEILKKNYDMKEHMLSLATEELYFVYSCIGTRQSNMLTKSWIASDKRQSLVTNYLNRVNDSCEEHREDNFNREGDYIDVENHLREEALRGLEEE